MSKEEKVLVYHHQAYDRPVVQDGLGTMRLSELEAVLTKESDSLQLGRKSIPYGAVHVDITPRDLLDQEQLKSRDRKPNDDSNIASVRLPAAAFVMRATGVGFNELYIVSRKQEEEIASQYALGKV